MKMKMKMEHPYDQMKRTLFYIAMSSAIELASKVTEH